MKKEVLKEALAKMKADRKAKKNGVIIHSQGVTREEYEDLLRRVQILRIFDKT
jgi:hypothetical protein